MKDSTREILNDPDLLQLREDLLTVSPPFDTPLRGTPVESRFQVDVRHPENTPQASTAERGIGQRLILVRSLKAESEHPITGLRRFSQRHQKKRRDQACPRGGTDDPQGGTDRLRGGVRRTGHGAVGEPGANHRSRSVEGHAHRFVRLGGEVGIAGRPARSRAGLQRVDRGRAAGCRHVTGVARIACDALLIQLDPESCGIGPDRLRITQQDRPHDPSRRQTAGGLEDTRVGRLGKDDPLPCGGGPRQDRFERAHGGRC